MEFNQIITMTSIITFIRVYSKLSLFHYMTTIDFLKKLDFQVAMQKSMLLYLSLRHVVKPTLYYTQARFAHCP
jgi:hypothetical protein